MSTAISQINTLRYLGRPASLQEAYLITESGNFGFLAELRQISPDNIMLNELGAKDVLRDLARIAASSGAVVATSGAGGDVIVDALFAAQSAASVLEGMSSIASDAGEFGQALVALKGTSITQGTAAVYSKVEKAILSLLKLAKKAGTKAVDFIRKVKKQIMSVLKKITTTVSDWIGALIPDDFGLGGPIIREFINEMVETLIENPYNIAATLINQVPIIMDPPRLKTKLLEYLDNFIEFLNDMENPKALSKKLAGKAVTAAKIAGTVVAPQMTAVIKAVSAASEKLTGDDLTSLQGIKNFLNTTIREAIPGAVDTFEKIMSIFFAVVAALQVVMQYDAGDAEDKEDKDASSGAADAEDVTPAESGDDQEAQGDERMAAGYYRSGQPLRELREFIHYALEES
jgi:hypothetical protein